MRARLFRGWQVVIAAHVLFALIFGAAYSFGAFFNQIAEDFGVGHFSVASIFSCMAVMYYATGAFSGALADCFSTRAVVVAGVVSLAGGLFASSLVSHSLTLFSGWFCVLGGLGIGLVYVPTVTCVQRWFIRNRSKASGLALAGTGMGTFIGPSLAGWLMSYFSWQATLRLFACGILLVGLLAAWFIRATPQSVGLLPDGDPPPSVPLRGASVSPLTMSLSQAIRGGRFWWFFAAIFLGSIGLFLALVHLNPYASQWGLSAARANLLVSLIGVGNVGGRLFLGSLGDRIGAVRLLIGLSIGLALLNMLWLGAESFLPLAIFAVLFGAANGGCISIYPSVAARWYGAANLGAILGALYLSVGIAAVVGGSFSGLLFDLYHSYTPPILLGALCALASVGLIVLADKRGPAASPANSGQ